jgi:hypothetical protein
VRQFLKSNPELSEEIERRVREAVRPLKFG